MYYLLGYGSRLEIAILSVFSNLLKLGNSLDPSSPFACAEVGHCPDFGLLVALRFLSFLKIPPTFSLLLGQSVWPSASGGSSSFSWCHRRGARTRGTLRCKEIRQVSQRFSHVQNKRQVLDWALLTTATLTHIRSTPKRCVFWLCLRALNLV